MLTKELDDIINVFQSCLTKKHHSTRAPRYFDATLDQRDRVSRAFLQAGDREWFLYQLVTLEHIPIAEKLDELPDEELLLVVAQIRNIHEHPTIIALRRHVLEASYRAGDRQKRLRATRGCITDVNASTSKRLRHCSPQRTTPIQLSTVESENFSALSAVPMPFEAGQDVTNLSQSGNPARPDYESPEARNLPFMFSHYLCDAILKTGSKASIRLFFPSDPKLSHMVIEIMAREAARIAEKLFRVHIREEDNKRTIVMEHGPIIEIIGHTRLKRVDTRAVKQMMGDRIYSGIQNSQQREKELMEGKMFSDCLSMMVGESAASSCHLTIQMDALALSRIHVDLWSTPNAELPATAT
ncbi:hypothetical protein CABS01_16805 [Colletotrichum abscissum]|uniref:Uncharacterized protein n=1 Tax=Colletotrichum tamarilloi TaxID=1209934 RepID=A0ABQ9QGU0_9PEZI|nr:uncharacterized protein CTAM01_17031 [Colletotrichum tamarilloi]XP_060402871.1 uncharacterized protein CABS01_16805 [Colletotrichum abscissum]KAK1466166.1 hypothetical protein CTAM01_17031 [Colletotrichum tamarilloi]KAK1511067.1 hypothetical protein CABS01_16805 [Colletotrichum abscissum]